MKLPHSLGNGDPDESQSLLKGHASGHGTPSTNNRRILRKLTSSSQITSRKDKDVVASAKPYTGDPYSFWEFTGLNFLVPALTVWAVILVFVWWSELKDNALDYYYLQYPEQQPLSPIPGTVLPLVPNVWVFNPDQTTDDSKDERPSPLKKDVQKHLKEHRQPHYYMLPQDFYDQQPPSDHVGTDTSTDGTNTALEAPKIRGVLVVLHNCHQSGLHFFQLPESRLIAAHALQRGLAIFSPTASSAPSLLTTNSIKTKPKGDGRKEKDCWSVSLDGDELLGPLLYEWARQMDVVSLPRMAIGVANGANLLLDSSLYKTLRLQSMALYGSHHPEGFDAADLELDVVPATTFVVFPKNEKGTKYAVKHFNTLRQQEDQDEDQEGRLRKEEEKAELEKEDEDLEDGTATQKTKTFFHKAQLYEVGSHAWTVSLCQERLPEYHTRCRSFFRHLSKFQKKRQRKAELKEMKRDPKARIKRLRLGGLDNKKAKYQLISSKGEVLQSSKSPNWIPVLENLGLDDWTTHMMAFTLASYGGVRKADTKDARQKKTQMMQFPTTATPEGRSWLWASMLQEIEVAYGLQEMTSEYSLEILDFLMYHAGLAGVGKKKV